jgi:hypothetical protein
MKIIALGLDNCGIKMENALKHASGNTVYIIVYKIQFVFELKKEKCNLSQSSRKCSSNTTEVMQWGTVSTATSTLR